MIGGPEKDLVKFDKLKKMIENNLQLMEEWDSDLRVICHAHYDAAVMLERKNYYFGVPVIILSTFVGTSVFATIQQNPNSWAKIIFGLINFFIAIMAVLQTFFKYSSRAEQHRKFGAKYGSLLKEFELYSSIKLDEDKFLNWCEDFKVRWDNLSLEAPTIPHKIWLKNYKRHKQKST